MGQAIRWVTRNKYLQYPEEVTGFQCPDSYQRSKSLYSGDSTPALASPDALEKTIDSPEDDRPVLTQAPTAIDRESVAMSDRILSKIMTRPEMSQVNTRVDLEQAYTNATKQETLKNQPSRPIAPAVTADGTILVDWYTTDDPENPQNWSNGKKLVVVIQIYIYTLAVYMGSAIYTPSIPYVVEQMGVSENVAALGLSMYVLGYGIGPLIFSPLSEIPVIGRNPPYILTLGIFVIISIPTAVVNNFPALIVLRFLQGFFGSPCLATGGASIGDIYSLLKMPYFLTGWAAFATAGKSRNHPSPQTITTNIYRSCSWSHHLRLFRPRRKLALVSLGSRLALRPCLHLPALPTPRDFSIYHPAPPRRSTSKTNRQQKPQVPR